MSIYNIINTFMKSKYKMWIYYFLIISLITYSVIIYIKPTKKQSIENKEVIIDVRSKTEWDLGHHPDAIHIPYYNLNELDYPKATKLVLYCNSGRRATLGKQTLEKSGYTNVAVKTY
jgi:phage shock protein E